MLSGYESSPGGTTEPLRWTARVRSLKSGGTTITARDHSLSIANPISFKPKGDPAPSSLDAFLSAIGGEIVTGLLVTARRANLICDECECLVSCVLENPLVAARVNGESGSPKITYLEFNLYVATPDAKEPWDIALSKSLSFLPLFCTLRLATDVHVQLQITP